MLVVGYEVVGLDKVIGEVAAPATGHQYFFAHFIGFFQDQHSSPPGCSG
jgi:hypothetical protein